MLIQRKLQNLLLINALVFVGLLLMVSIGLAQSGTWKRKADIPTPRIFASSCELNGKIYVIGGGKTAYSSLNVMEVYDPVTNIWDTTKAPMHTARAGLCVAAVKGKIYAIGGATSHVGSTLDVVEVYDPSTNTWDTNKKPMPTPRKGAACGVIDDKIYIAGGTAVSNWLPASDKLEIYDPATDTWDTNKANLRKAILNTQGAVVHDMFYVIGGLVNPPWKGQSTVQKYDPISDTCEYGINLINGRVGHTTNILNGKIYAIGGDGQPPIIENVEEYNPQTETWEVIDTIPSPMIIHTSSVYDNEIYVFSGSTDGMPELTLTNRVYSYKPPITSIREEKNSTPDVFVLHQNYPNPFNPSTTIKFNLPKTEHVTVEVINVLGQKITKLLDQRMIGGQHQVEFDGRHFSSGVYYYQIKAGEYYQVKKMLLIK